MRYSEIVAPFWVRQVRKLLTAPTHVLDFGCANDSPHTTKRWFTSCIYHGADISEASNTDLVDVFYNLDVKDDLVQIPNRDFDLVLMKHVIEHLSNPLDTLQALIRKLKPGGVIYLSFPHPRSVNFPSADGTLNFYDDPTHVWVPSISDIVDVMDKNRIEVVKKGTIRSIDKIVFGIPFLILNMARRAVGAKAKARGMWDIYGFEYHVIGRVRLKG